MQENIKREFELIDAEILGSNLGIFYIKELGLIFKSYPEWQAIYAVKYQFRDVVEVLLNHQGFNREIMDCLKILIEPINLQA